MPSIPVSLFGFLGFIILTGFLMSSWLGSDPNSQLSKVSEDTNTQLLYIQSIQTNQSSDWFSSITNTGNIILASFKIALNYISMPIGFVTESIVTILSLPSDIAPLITVIILFAFIAGIAIFIRSG